MSRINFFGRLPAGISRALAERAVKAALKASRTQTGEVAVAFVSPVKMRKLNRQKRGQNRPTDVLSFAPVWHEKSRVRELGDVIICPSRVKRDATRGKVAYREQLLRVLAHGVLHLAGMDHARRKDEKRMLALQEKIVRSL